MNTQIYYIEAFVMRSVADVPLVLMSVFLCLVQHEYVQGMNVIK